MLPSRAPPNRKRKQMAAYQKGPQMPPVVGGAGAGYKDMPEQKQNTLPPVVGGEGGGHKDMPRQRPDELPPVIG